MNAIDHSPIRYPDVIAAPNRVAAALLEPARVQPCYEGMDDTSQFAIERKLHGERIEAARAKQDLDDTLHDLRVEWQHAIDNQHQLSTPKLPTAVAGKVVMVPVTELVGTLMDTCAAVQLLCEALRTGDLTRLHLQLRMTWLDANASDLAEMGWQP